MCERKGEAVVCLQCGGSGCRKIKYKPFTSRKPARGINSIRESRGAFLFTGAGGTGKEMTYEQF